ncbi:MAG: AAA family ATPase [Candidatus Adiutrix sp.]|jgi:predicted ATP-dependent endonuclease of OLD family|nr:AAA family ATPase [Candidatus Adiutrix sp.]
MLKEITFERFTAFQALTVNFSPGINIFIGENGTGKTHILKTAYAACEVSKSGKSFARKINDVFYPLDKQVGRLVKRASVSSDGWVEIVRRVGLDGGVTRNAKLKLSLTSRHKAPEQARVVGETFWQKHEMETAYIPVKDMLANSPGFQALYETREIHFEEVYVDILRKAQLPALRGPADAQRKRLRDILGEAINGRVELKNEEFFLKNSQGNLEFTLLAEGFRKLGLLSLLIQNGTLLNGSALFWDEPESNLNPKLMKIVTTILLALQRSGVQIFISTHDYSALKEFDLQAEPGRDQVSYHSLYRRTEDGEIAVSSTEEYSSVSPNAIDEAFSDFIDRDIAKSMKGFKK